jgi:hypothetical protein
VLDGTRDVMWPLIGRREELDFIASVLEAVDSGGVFLAGALASVSHASHARRSPRRTHAVQ